VTPPPLLLLLLLVVGVVLLLLLVLPEPDCSVSSSTQDASTGGSCIDPNEPSLAASADLQAQHTTTQPFSTRL
jgi:hypothetical protein